MRPQLFKNLAVMLVCLSVLVFLILVLKGTRVENYRDNKVIAGEFRRVWDVFAAHISRPKYLIVAGKTYRGIRGQAPYYLDVPGTNAILFVTQAAGNQITFHILNLNTKEEIQINGGTSGFGWGIGGNRKPGEKFTDYIDGVESNHMTLVIRSGDWKEVMVLNLTAKVIDRRETFRFSK